MGFQISAPSLPNFLNLSTPIYDFILCVFFIGAGNVTHSVKCLIHKCENLSANSRTYRKPDKVAHACDPRAREMKIRDYLGLSGLQDWLN